MSHRAQYKGRGTGKTKWDAAIYNCINNTWPFAAVTCNSMVYWWSCLIIFLYVSFLTAIEWIMALACTLCIQYLLMFVFSKYLWKYIISAQCENVIITFLGDFFYNWVIISSIYSSYIFLLSPERPCNFWLTMNMLHDSCWERKTAEASSRSLQLSRRNWECHV